MPKRTALVLALVLLTIGVELRNHYFYIEQYALKLLIVSSIAILVCSVAMSLLKSRGVTLRDSLAFAVVVPILCGFTYESVASNKLKNQQYLEKLGGMISRFAEENHRLPDDTVEALKPLEMLPNRGDADGNGLSYIRISYRIFVLRSSGPEPKYDGRPRHAVQLNYLNGVSVSFEDLRTWVQSNGTPDEKNSLDIYFPPSPQDR